MHIKIFHVCDSNCGVSIEMMQSTTDHSCAKMWHWSPLKVEKINFKQVCYKLRDNKITWNLENTVKIHVKNKKQKPKSTDYSLLFDKLA